MNERIQSSGAWVRRARSEGWAIGQFNMSNLETLQGIVSAANAASAPVFVGTSMGTLRHAGLEYIAAMVEIARAKSSVPLFLHLDHGPDLATIEACIRHGWDSVMIDASMLPYDDNVALVREVVAMAHPAGVAVEAQIGQTWEEDGDRRESIATVPHEAHKFVQATGVDYIAVSIGNTPGKTTSGAPVDLELLANVAKETDAPIVMHGGTSVPDEAMRRAIALGVAKVNIDTALRVAVTEALVGYYCGNGAGTDPRIPLRLAREAVERAVLERIALFGATGQALQGA